MAFVNRLKTAEDASLLPTGCIQPSSWPTSGLKSISAGHNGLRAGWRLLTFLGVPAAVLVVIVRASRDPGQFTITPFLPGANDALVFLIRCVVTWFLAKIYLP